MSAVEKLTQTCAAANVKRADALGSIELVARDGEQVQVQSVYVNGKLASGLDGIGVEIHVSFGGDAANLRERLHSAQFIVRVHHGKQDGLLAESLTHGFRIDLAFAIDREISDRHAGLFQGLAGVENGFVLDGASDD